MKSIHWIAVAIFATSHTYAIETMDEIVVQSTRIPTSLDLSTSSVEVITEADIFRSNLSRLDQILAKEVGLHIAQTGGANQPSSLYLRGAKPHQTLILIDGVKVNGQTDLNGYDISSMDLSNIERIEILKGPQSTLYGSDAMAGVINIITKTGSREPTVSASAELGSHAYYRGNLSTHGTVGIMQYSASIQHTEEDGISAKQNDAETDPSSLQTLTTRLTLQPSEALQFKAGIRYIDAHSDYDDTNPNASPYVDKKQLIADISAHLTATETYQSSVQFSIADLQRNHHSIGSSINTTDTDEQWLTYDWINTLQLSDAIEVIVGTDYTHSAYDYLYSSLSSFGPYVEAFDGSRHQHGAYAITHYKPSQSTLIHASLRNDSDSIFGSALTYQAGIANTIQPSKTTLRASFGTGYRAPTAYQLYSYYGNSALQEETSQQFEAGFDQKINDRISFNATFFHTRYEQLIETEYGDPNDYNDDSYLNIPKANSQGVELATNLRLLDQNRLEVTLGYTYLDNDDQYPENSYDEAENFELRRPFHVLFGEVNYLPIDRLNLNLYVRHTDQTKDLDFVNFAPVIYDLKAHTRVDLSASYQLTETLRLFTRIENVTDITYARAYSYNAPGRSFYGGISVEL